MKTTLTDKDLDLLTFASGVLHSNKDTHQLAHGLLDLRNRQRALGVAPTESAATVAERVGDPELAKKFAPPRAVPPPYRTMKERNAAAEEPDGDFFFKVKHDPEGTVYHAKRRATDYFIIDSARPASDSNGADWTPTTVRHYLRRGDWVRVEDPGAQAIGDKHAQWKDGAAKPAPKEVRRGC